MYKVYWQCLYGNNLFAKMSLVQQDLKVKLFIRANFGILSTSKPTTTRVIDNFFKFMIKSGNRSRYLSANNSNLNSNLRKRHRQSILKSKNMCAIPQMTWKHTNHTNLQEKPYLACGLNKNDIQYSHMQTNIICTLLGAIFNEVFDRTRLK